MCAGQHQSAPLNDATTRFETQVEITLDRQQPLPGRQQQPTSAHDLGRVPDRDMNRVVVVFVAVASGGHRFGRRPPSLDDLATAQPEHRVEVGFTAGHADPQRRDRRHELDRDALELAERVLRRVQAVSLGS